MIMDAVRRGRQAGAAADARRCRRRRRDPRRPCVFARPYRSPDRGRRPRTDHPPKYSRNERESGGYPYEYRSVASELGFRSARSVPRRSNTSTRTCSRGHPEGPRHVRRGYERAGGSASWPGLGQDRHQRRKPSPPDPSFRAAARPPTTRKLGVVAEPLPGRRSIPTGPPSSTSSVTSGRPELAATWTRGLRRPVAELMLTAEENPPPEWSAIAVPPHSSPAR